MGIRGHRVIVVSERTLVVQGITSLLETDPAIGDIEVVGGLWLLPDYASAHPPDAVVVDIPCGSGICVDRPLLVDGREVRTIVLREGASETLLYVQRPGQIANLENLRAAVLFNAQVDDPAVKVHADGILAQTALVEDTTQSGALSQPNSLMTARAAGPSRPRMSASRPGLYLTPRDS